jgi:WhiB family transcriptional regulator, redox-sensing transcriptional regulator
MAAMRQAEKAKAVCADCPVRRDCLEWAIETDQPHGVWGGLDEVERGRLAGGGRGPQAA